MTGGKLDQAKVGSAFQAAITGGRLALVERLWDVAGDGTHPSLTYSDTSEDKTGVKSSPVTLLLKKGRNDAHWEGLEIARWLVEKGCDLKARGADGSHLLEIAVEADDLAMVKYLLSQGFDANMTGRYDSPALGAVEGDEDMAMLLIENGADPWVLNTKDYNYMAYVKGQGWTRVMAWMEAHKPAGA